MRDRFLLSISRFRLMLFLLHQVVEETLRLAVGKIRHCDATEDSGLLLPPPQ